MRSMRRLALIPIAGMMALGCGSPAATTKPKTTSPSTTAPASSTTAVNQTASASSTVPASAASDQCTPDQLRPSWTGQGNGASGHLFYSVNLLNPSSSTCVTGGYVGVSAYDPAGNLIAASGSRDAMGTASPPTLTVAPGATLHFVVGLPDVNEATGGTACSTTVGALHLIPPNEMTDVQIATPISTGYPKLCGNTFLVGPLLSGAGV
jgi:hypothetical protein